MYPPHIDRPSLLRNLVFRERAAANGLLLAHGEVTVASAPFEDLRSVALRGRWMAVVTTKRLLLLDMRDVRGARPLLPPSRETFAKAAIGPYSVAGYPFI